jgi:PKD repeat protein
MVTRLLTVISFILCANLLFGQKFIGEKVNVQSADLAEQFTHSEVYRLDIANLNAMIKKNNGTYGNPLELQFGALHWKLDLVPSGITKEGYILQVQSLRGLEKYYPKENKAFKGTESNSKGAVRMTIDKDFLHGYVHSGEKMYFVEPLYYHEPKAERNLFVVYERKDVIRDHDASCGMEDLEENREILKHRHEEEMHGFEGQENNGIFELELAIASDRSMFDKYGSETAVENHNIAVINDVEGDYTGSFTHDLCIEIVTQFIVTGTDPAAWTTSNDAGTFLGGFRSWGQAGGFGVSFDLGEIWTNRDFTGGTVGIAFLNAVCNTVKYHALQDFTANAELLRCMTSHEIGHNFNSGHDAVGGGSCPTNFIMCPFVSTSSTWSTQSINAINAHMAPRVLNGCLTVCGPPPPPSEANFEWSPNPACVGQSVQFTDLSTGNITSRSWTFTSGTPGTSTQTNPTVVWNTPGTFNVKLTVTSPGGSVSTTKQVVIKPQPVANFTFTVDGLTVSFNSTSVNAVTHEWDFGDGQSSFDEDPVYTYGAAGNYTVKLTVTNECGTATRTLFVITAPTADFIANPTTGCAPLSVQYTSQASANATAYIWQFQGGTPSTSTQPNPIILYPTAGTYGVTLTASNVSGSSSMVKTSFIKVNPKPTASFTHADNGLSVNFTNTSAGGGNLWSAQTAGATGAFYSVHFASSNTGWKVGSNGAIVNTNNSGSTWTAQTSGTLNDLRSVHFFDINIGWAVGNNGTILKTVNSGNSWISQASGTTNDLRSVHFISANTGWAVGSNGTIRKTINGGTTWVAQPSGTLNDLRSVRFVDANTGWAVGFNGTILTTNNGGTSWTAQISGTINNLNSVHFVSINIGWAVGNGGIILHTANGGNTWTAQKSGTTNALNSVYFVSANNGWAVGNGGLILNTTKGGNNWSVQTSGTINNLNSVHFIDANTGWTAGDNNTILTTINGANYVWDFGDTNTSTQQNPTHDYNASGTYTVTLTVTNSCGTATATKTITIAGPPTATFTATNLTGCNSLAVQYTNTSTGSPTAFLWVFPGGSPDTSKLANPLVIYNTPGTYSVTLTVSNQFGTSTATQANYVTLNADPKADFTHTISNFTTVNFTNISTAGTFPPVVSYLWQFDDGKTSTLANPVHVYTTDGTYKVKLIATNVCGADTMTQTVVIVTPPTANFTATPVSGCVPMTVQFANESSANATTYNWSFPGGNPSSSNAPNPSVTYATAGNYSVILTVGNAAGTSTSEKASFVVTNTKPSPGFDQSTSGRTLTLSNTSTNANTYSWAFGDGNNSTQNNPIHTYINDGTYTVTLTASNGCGDATSTKTVVIVTPPTANFSATPTVGCPGLTVKYNNTSSNNATTFTWTFPGGNPSTSTVQNPTVTYATAGTYSATLVASNSQFSDTRVLNNFVQVNPTPTAGFSSSNNGATASFTNTSVNATTYSWAFGDNNSSTQQNPTHNYATDGTYTVTLTATNACGTATSSKTVVIVTTPTANFNANNTNGCAPLTVQFNNTSSSNATTFQWEFPGGTPSSSSDKNPTVTYSAAGVYSVTLTSGNAAGSGTAVQSNYVNVAAGPKAGFSSSVSGLTASFTNSSTNGNSYSWNFGDTKTSTDANPSHTYAKDGNYTVVLTVTNACGTNTFTQNVAIITSPNAGFTANTTNGCSTLTVQFKDLSSGTATSWLWNFPGGTPGTSTAQNPTVTYSTAGVYDVTLVASGPGGTSTFTQPAFITVKANPTAGFGNVVNGTSVTFSNSSTNATSYLWNFGDSSNSTEENPTHTYSAPGTYTVTLTATNSCGTVSSTKTVEIAGAAPTANFKTTDGQAGCLPFTVTFDDLSTGNPTTWNWSFPGGTPATSTQQKPTVTYSQAGVYDVVLVAGNTWGNNTATKSKFIEVQPFPTAAFTFTTNGGTVSFSNSSTNATQYSWNFGDNKTSTETNPTHTYATNGTYTVLLTALNPCGAAPLEKQITINIIGTEEQNWLSYFRLYPNPNEGRFAVEMHGESANEVEFILFNALGQQIRRDVSDFNTGTLTQNLDYGQLPSGVYNLHIQAGLRVMQVKVTVQR